MAGQHSCDRDHPRFWLKPAITANGSVLTECLWYDTVPEAEALLHMLVSGPEAPDGELRDDLDQGWQVRIVKIGNLSCLCAMHLVQALEHDWWS